jgi:hypothetical protein
LQAHPLWLIQWHTHLTTGRLCAIRPAGFKQFYPPAFHNFSFKVWYHFELKKTRESVPLPL